MLDITKLWDKIYLFGPNPVDLTRSDLIFFWISLVFILAGIAAKVMYFRQEPTSPKRFLLSRLFHLFITMGILILVWIGLRFENIPWLGTHIVVLLLLLIWLVWLVFIARFFLREFKHRQRAFEEEKLKQKYLQ